MEFTVTLWSSLYRTLDKLEDLEDLDGPNERLLRLHVYVHVLTRVVYICR
jgi:hypothetical protein